MRASSILSILFLASSCGTGGGDPRCTTGTSSACACADGRSGAQVCANGAYGACDCTGGTPSPGPGPGNMTAPGGPVFLSFGTNVTSLTANQTVTFSAVVSHPAGLDQIAGGTLSDSGGTAQYGAFGSGTQKGGFSITLSWGELNQVQPIAFKMEQMRGFVATFFDTSGRKSTQVLSIRLHCNGLAACAGACVNLDRDAKNCGTCGNDCFDDACIAGVCDNPTAMAGVVESTVRTSCGTVCIGVGRICGNTCQQAPGQYGAGVYGSGVAAGDYYPVASCTEVPPASYDGGGGTPQPFSGMLCCCP
jgi:hypothetical protein